MEIPAIDHNQQRAKLFDIIEKSSALNGVPMPKLTGAGAVARSQAFSKMPGQALTMPNFGHIGLTANNSRQMLVT